MKSTSEHRKVPPLRARQELAVGAVVGAGKLRRSPACAWRVSLSHFLQYRINCNDLYECNYEFGDFGLMKCFRTAAIEADSVAEGSWDAEASVVLPLRFLGG